MIKYYISALVWYSLSDTLWKFIDFKPYIIGINAEKTAFLRIRRIKKYFPSKFKKK